MKGFPLLVATVLLGVWDPKERDLLRSLLRGATTDPTT